jgi:hypothetical protein
MTAKTVSMDKAKSIDYRFKGNEGSSGFGFPIYSRRRNKKLF